MSEIKSSRDRQESNITTLSEMGISLQCNMTPPHNTIQHDLHGDCIHTEKYMDAGHHHNIRQPTTG